MNLPPTYRHDYGYEQPQPAPVYDTPRIVERRPMLAWLRLALRRPRPAEVHDARKEAISTGSRRRPAQVR